MRFIPTLDTIDADAAREVAVRMATDRGLPVCVAIVDASGVLLDLHRSDAAKAHTVDLASRKAAAQAAHSPPWDGSTPRGRRSHRDVAAR